MALDVLRHRLVLSYEALSDNVTSDDLLTTILEPHPGARSCRCDEHTDVRVTRLSASCSGSTGRSSAGWMACCRATTAACSTATGWTLPICANTSRATMCATSTGTSPRAWTRPTCASYLEDREITAWFLLDLSPSMDFGTVERERRSARC